MPRHIPDLAHRFEQRVNRTLSLAEAGETIFATSPRNSIAKRKLRLSHLEALYEMTYLRIFLEWETFLEESFIRYLCGYHSSQGPPPLLQPPARTLADARHLVLGGRDYVSWASVSATETRCKKFFKYGLHERVLLSNRARLEWFSYVRHRIAHSSDYARMMFDRATMSLVGHRYRGSSPGRFLRDWDNTCTPRERQLHAIGDEMKNLAKQIVP
jgi:hypothetical protein